MKINNGYESHRFVLEHVIKMLKNKSVLELGAGDFSTNQIHEIIGNENSKIITIDTDLSWLEKYMHLKTDYHDLIYWDIDKLNDFFNNDKNQWGLVFVDTATFESRISAIMKYRESADYLILHDCDYYANSNTIGKTIKPVNAQQNDMGIRDYGKEVFKHWVEYSIEDWASYNSWIPPTLLASNKYSLDNIKIDNMIITNKSN